MQQRYAVLFAVMIAAGCGGASGDSKDVTNPTGTNPGGTSANAVSIVNLTFSPATLTVAAGTSVTWSWSQCDSSGGYGGYAACVMHQIVFDDGSNIKSPVQDSGTFIRTFAAAGTYKYHCAIHGSAMSGEVDVK